MMALSVTRFVEVAAGGASASAEVLTGPAVLTSIVVCESTGAAGARITLTAHGAPESVYMVLMPLAGQSLVWTGEAALGSGLDVVCTAGAAAVTIGYY